VSHLEDIRAVLLCRLDDGLKLRAIRVLVDTALQPEPATNTSALRLTLADEPNWPGIAPEVP
jgi:hypothetical protein